MPAIKTQFQPRMSEALALKTISENSIMKKIAKVVASVFVGAGLGAWEFGLSIPFRLPLPLAIVGFIPLLPISIGAAVGGFVYGAVAGVVMTIQAMKQKEPTQVEPTQVEPTQVEPTQEEIRLRLHRLIGRGSVDYLRVSHLYGEMSTEEGVFRMSVESGSNLDQIVNFYFRTGEGEIEELSVHGLAKLLKMCFAKLNLFESVNLEEVDEKSEESVKNMLVKLSKGDLTLLFEFLEICKDMLASSSKTKWDNADALAVVIAPALFPISESKEVNSEQLQKLKKQRSVTSALIYLNFRELINQYY